MTPLLDINRNLRSLNRYREVLGVLVGHGFGQVLEQLNLDYYIELGRRFIRLDPRKHEIERLPPPVRLRMALEQLGPTFIKLGQLLSSRPDLLPVAYTDEFKKLQNDVVPVDDEEIERQILKELGAAPQQLFASFSATPVAAASIAQVHRAHLFDGREVAVKIRRPGIEKIIETDLDILEGLASLYERHGNATQLFCAPEIVREFRRTIYRELDFTKEGHTLSRFRDLFATSTTVVVPAVHWEFTTDAVLTMDYIDGIKISRTDDLQAAGHDLSALAHNGAQAFLDQVLVHGLFHGDPHPGNLLVTGDGAICFLDLGIMGHVDDELRHQLINLLLATFRRDIDAIATVLLTARDRNKEVDTSRLKRELAEFLDDYYMVPLARIKTFKLINEFIGIMQRHHIRFPADLMLLARALITIEGIGRQLDPQFNLVEQLQPLVTKLLQQRLSPFYISQEAGKVAGAYADILRILPGEIKDLLLRVNGNNFKINLQHRGLDKLISDLDKSSNRLSFSFIIGALIIASSLIISSDSGPHIFGIPALGLLGYLLAGALGLWLALGIIRSGRL